MLTIIREDLPVSSGLKESMAGYAGVNLQTGNAMIEKLAMQEQEKIGGALVVTNELDIDPNRTVHVATVLDKNKVPVCRYYGKWE